jgi:hypothetical protein
LLAPARGARRFDLDDGRLVRRDLDEAQALEEVESLLAAERIAPYYGTIEDRVLAALVAELTTRDSALRLVRGPPMARRVVLVTGDGTEHGLGVGMGTSRGEILIWLDAELHAPHRRHEFDDPRAAVDWLCGREWDPDRVGS